MAGPKWRLEVKFFNFTVRCYEQENHLQVITTGKSNLSFSDTTGRATRL